MSTKHEQIIKFIENLELNARVSVRRIAKELDVSEGTAYRAIKEAENRGLVSSIPKVGTVRIQERKNKQIEDLTLAEIAEIVDGIVIHGQKAGALMPSRFVIGSMSTASFDRVVEKGSLVLVENREDIQMKALQKGAYLLVAGGFEPAGPVLSEARQRELPIISTPYGTFEAAAIITHALHDRYTKKELILVEDIMVTDVDYLTDNALVADWYHLSKATNHSRFPVVDAAHVVVGMVTAVNVAGVDSQTPIERVMTRAVFQVEKTAPVTHVSRVMLWEELELVPVVEDGRLIGVISPQDIIETLQQVQKQPHYGETVDNIILSGFRLEETTMEGAVASGVITDFMTNDFGTVSSGTLVTLMNYIGYIAVRKHFRAETVTENFVLYQVQPVEVGTVVEVNAQLIQLEKKHGKLDVVITAADKLVAKGLMTVRVKTV